MVYVNTIIYLYGEFLTIVFYGLAREVKNGIVTCSTHNINVVILVPRSYW